MGNTTFRNGRINSLKKGKTKSLGLFETLKMKLLGFIDGLRGYPKKDENGRWLSAHMDREINAYEEFCSRMWGTLQIETEEMYSRLGGLIDGLSDMERQVADAKNSFEAAVQAEGNHKVTRKNGEENLTEAQVSARRGREREKRLSPMRSRIATAENARSAAITEFLDLRNKLIENNNTTRMICNRVKDHMLQRVDVYWNSALRRHPDKEMMPAVPLISIEYNAEKVFMEPHMQVMRKAEELSKLASRNSSEEVA